LGKVLLACHGISQSIHEYTYKDKKCISKATFAALPKLSGDIEKIVLFVTPEARVNAEKIMREENIQIEVTFNVISATEFEEMIEKMFDYLDKNPDVIIDLSQGYRHQPMLLLLATLIESIEAEKKRRIFFALEKERASGEKHGKSEFVDLTVYIDIVYFNQILHLFGKSVNMPSYITRRIHDQELRRIGKQLAKFSNFFFENNIPEMERAVSELKNNLNKLSDNPRFRFSKIGIRKAIEFLGEIEKIKLSSIEAEKFLLLSRVYNERNYQLNAVTNLLEALLCIVELMVIPLKFQKKLEKSKNNFYSVRNAYKRLLISGRVMDGYGNIIVSRNEFDKRKLSKVEKNLRNILGKVDEMRNSMAHGFVNRKKVKKSDKLSQRIGSYIRETEKILKEIREVR